MKHPAHLLLACLCALLLVPACSGGDKEQMLHQLEELERMNRAYEPMTNDTLAQQLVEYFDRHGTPNERMRAYYMLGSVYRDLGEMPKALDCFLIATEKADTTGDCDYRVLLAIYGQMADIYHAQYLPEDELRALLQSEHFAWKANDTIAAIKAYELRERPYYFQNDTDAIIRIEHEARERYLKAGKTDYAGRALVVSVSLYLSRGQYDEAWKAMQIVENESGWFDDNGNVRKGKEQYYYDKGRYCLGTGKPDSARIYFHRALAANRKEAGYKGLMTYYQYMQIPDSIAKYAQLFAIANDSCYYSVNQEKVHQISAMYDYTRQKQIAEKEEQNARKARQVRNALIIVIILAAAFVVLWIHGIKARARKKYLRLASAYEKNRLELTAAMDRQQLLAYDYASVMREKDNEKQKLLQQIKDVEDSNLNINQDKDNLLRTLTELQKEQELLAKLHEEDNRHKEIEINALRAKTEKQEKLLQQYRSIDMEAAFKSSACFKLFNERKEAKWLGNPPTEENWQQLIGLFRTHFVSYYTFITYEHRLSINQYRYCILFRLGFDSTEIGILMNKDKDQRYNLRKLIYEALFGTPVNVKGLEEKLKEHF